jgi:hypothetical protein
VSATLVDARFAAADVLDAGLDVISEVAVCRYVIRWSLLVIVSERGATIMCRATGQ